MIIKVLDVRNIYSCALNFVVPKYMLLYCRKCSWKQNTTLLFNEVVSHLNIFISGNITEGLTPIIPSWCRSLHLLPQTLFPYTCVGQIPSLRSFLKVFQWYSDLFIVCHIRTPCQVHCDLIFNYASNTRCLYKTQSSLSCDHPLSMCLGPNISHRNF
jgi:hypothetical protein